MPECCSSKWYLKPFGWCISIFLTCSKTQLSGTIESNICVKHIYILNLNFLVQQQKLPCNMPSWPWGEVLDCGAKRGWVVSPTVWLLYLLRKRPQYLLYISLSGPWASWDMPGKPSPTRVWTLDHQRIVAIPIMLSRLRTSWVAVFLSFIPLSDSA